MESLRDTMGGVSVDDVPDTAGDSASSPEPGHGGARVPGQCYVHVCSSRSVLQENKYPHLVPSHVCGEHGSTNIPCFVVVSDDTRGVNQDEEREADVELLLGYLNVIAADLDEEEENDPAEQELSEDEKAVRLVWR